MNEKVVMIAGLYSTSKKKKELGISYQVVRLIYTTYKFGHFHEKNKALLLKLNI